MAQSQGYFCSFGFQNPVLKLHPNIVQGILECLKLIFEENKYTDDVLDKAFRNHKQWGSRDRRFIAQSTYEIVRWWRLLFETGQSLPQEKDIYHNSFIVYLVKSGIELPEWLSEGIEVEKIQNQLQAFQNIRKIREAIPDWMDETAIAEIGEVKWETEVAHLNDSASIYLRVNTLKTEKSQLVALLDKKEIEVQSIPSEETSLILVKRQQLSPLEEYQKGLFEVQDIGSQKIAPFLQAQRGECIIDACAGGGGKTLHLAALLQNKGSILAMDVEIKKLSNLKERAQRAGATIIHTELIDGSTLEKHKETADRLLLDVPCSGLGVLKRNPDTKWKLTLSEIAKIKDLQSRILNTYPIMLKKGGTMVYATCSILPSENEGQIQEFLHSQKGKFEMMEECHLWPSQGGDGYYMARLRKNS